MFRRILVATDGSDNSRKAVELAMTLASNDDAEVVVVHVLLAGELDADLQRLGEVEFPKISLRPNKIGSTKTTIAAEVLQPLGAASRRAASYEIVRTLGEQVLQHAEQVLKSGGVNRVRARILDGNAVEQIMHAIVEEHPDAVICGARGLSNFQTLLLGSVSNKVAHLCPVTCITVR